MKVNPHKLLHYVLIMIMMFVPMRSVMAMQQSHCDMVNHITGSSTVISDYTGGHDMMAMSMSASSSAQKAENSHDCCSAKGDCTSDCHMSVSVSLLMQKSSYKPNFTNISGSVALISDLVKKEFTPPFRPPLVSLS